MNHPRPIQVLFLCTHNSARSILAEALLNHIGEGRFQAFSAGSHPASTPNPLALQVLQEALIPTQGLRSKSWNEFGREDAPPMDLVITVCDDAAGETCPYWPGQPAAAHWGYADPSAVKGSDDERLAAFRSTMLAIRHRLDLLVSLPLTSLDRSALQSHAHDLGAS
jgi:arsenate reductase